MINYFIRASLADRLLRLLAIVCIVLGATTQATAVDVTFTVASNTDDADEISSGTVYVTDGSSFFSSTRVGFRFQNVTIPAGATITSATLEVFSNGNGTTSFSVDILAQDADNPSTFTTTNGDITGRTITSAQTLWSTGAVSYSVGQSIVSPNFASSIQEVVNRSGWASGNSLVVITTANSGDKGIFKRSGSTTYAPRLYVSYTLPSVYYVRSDGNNSNSGTGSGTADAWATVAYAATQSLSPGAIVNVRAGTYTGTVSPTVDGTSSDPIRFVADTTGSISGWSAGSVVIQAPAAGKCLDTNSNDYLYFTGFTFAGDNAVDAVDIDFGTDVRLERCIVYGGNRGVGIDNGAQANLINCLIRNNVGDGIVIANGSANVFACTIVANGDDGIDAGNDSAFVVNSIIADNADFGLSRQSDGDGTVSQFYNLLHNNTSGNHNGTSSGTGEVTSDPQFVGSGDYRLQSGSPAIDAGLSLSGTVDDDLDGRSRPQGSAYDIGAYEHFPSTTYYVRSDGSDSNTGTGSSASEAWATVAGAATKSLAAGDIVYVRAGTYVGAVAPTVDGSSTAPIQFVADTTGSVSGWSAGAVTLQASGGNVLDLDSDDYIEFRGFTLQGTSGVDAVDIDFGQGVVISHCEIFGGADGIQSGNGADSTILNCLIHGNSADGISMSGGTFTVWNSTIAGNGSDGVEQHNGTMTITNSIIANNSSDGLDLNSGTMTHSYNLLFGNGSDDYEGTSASTGEINADPMFVSASDYHLFDTSPAIDAGTNAAGTVDDDLEGLSRPNGITWDLGCYESGLAGHYKLDETSGTIAADSSGNGHDGTLIGSPMWSTDAVFGGALEYDYTDGNDYVELPNSTQLDELQLGSYTITTWYKPSSVPPETGNSNLSGHGLVKKPNSSIGLHYSHITGFQFNHYADEGAGPVQQAITASVYGIGEYHHVACVVDQAAGIVEMYVNGVSVGTNTFVPGSPGFDTGTQQWRLGISGPGAPTAERPAHGIQDDVRLYSRALTASEVQAMYVAASGLVAHWKLDETSGTVALDSSVSGYDGAYNGSPTLNQAGPYPKEGAIAAEFSGTSGEKVALPSMNVNFSTGLTMAVWYKVDALTGGYTDFFSLSNGALVDDIWFGLDNSQGLDLFLSDTADGAAWRGLIANTGVPETGIWKHAVAVVNASGNAKLFSNGQLIASGYVGLPRAVDRTQNNIAETTFDHSLDGQLFDVRLYNRALSDSEVAELYGLVGHWKMDEGTGSTAADSTGFANDATLNGASWVTDCAGNNGLEFDGVTDTATTNSNFDPPETGAISVWLRSAGNPGSRSRPFGNGGNWEIRQEPDGTLSFDLGGEGPDVGAGGDEFVTTEGLSFENRWYHVVAQFDASDESFEIYIDGALVHSGVNGDDMTKQVANILSFGTRTGSSENWEGGMRDFRVYNRWISGKEITEISGLVALWKLDETSGTVAADSSPNGYDGTLIGNPTWTPVGQIGGSLDFETDDGDDRVDVGTFDVSGNEISLAAWVRPEDGSTDQRIIIKANGTALQDQYWGMAVGSSLELDFRIKAGGTTQFFTETNVLSPGRWYHVAGTYDGTTMRMYVNGDEVQSVTHSVGGALDEDNAVPVTLGAANVDGRDYDGRLDDVRVLSRVMCDEEVRDLYEGGRPAGVRIIEWVEVR